MAIKAMADNNQPITTKQDASMYDAFSNHNEGVLSKIGNKLNISYSNQSLLVTLQSGMAVVSGRHVTNEDDSSVTLTLLPNTTDNYLVIRYDLSQSTGNECSFISTPTVESDDLNNNGVKRDIVLGKYTTNETGVSVFTDMRTYFDRNNILEITLSTTWIGDDTSGYSQTVSVPGITENDSPDIYVKLVEGDKEGNEQKSEEFNKLSDSWTHADSIVFYANEKTTIELTLIVKGR